MPSPTHAARPGGLAAERAQPIVNALTIDVEEKMYAAGKIPGGFFKREGRATERATLTARMRQVGEQHLPRILEIA